MTVREVCTLYTIEKHRNKRGPDQHQLALERLIYKSVPGCSHKQLSFLMKVVEDRIYHLKVEHSLRQQCKNIIPEADRDVEHDHQFKELDGQIQKYKRALQQDKAINSTVGAMYM
jgi:hypothetical protein